MPWVKIDDKFPYHRKAILAGLEARALYITALCHCADQLTDGFVDEGVLPVMAALTGIQDASRCAAKLVEVGLWENAIGGYIVHDYHDYNPTREEVIAIRAERIEAGRTGGRRSGESRREAKDKQVALDLLEENEANDEAKTNPVPVPVPVPVPESGSSFAAKNAAGENPHKRSDRQLAISALEGEFSSITAIPLPGRATDREKMSASVGWWQPLAQIWEMENRNTPQSIALIRSAVEKMRGDSLVIASPKSILKVAISIHGNGRSGDTTCPPDKLAQAERMTRERLKASGIN